MAGTRELGSRRGQKQHFGWLGAYHSQFASYNALISFTSYALDALPAMLIFLRASYVPVGR